MCGLSRENLFQNGWLENIRVCTRGSVLKLSAKSAPNNAIGYSFTDDGPRGHAQSLALLIAGAKVPFLLDSPFGISDYERPPQGNCSFRYLAEVAGT